MQQTRSLPYPFLKLAPLDSKIQNKMVYVCDNKKNCDNYGIKNKKRIDEKRQLDKRDKQIQKTIMLADKKYLEVLETL